MLFHHPVTFQRITPIYLTLNPSPEGEGLLPSLWDGGTPQAWRRTERRERDSFNCREPVLNRVSLHFRGLIIFGADTFGILQAMYESNHHFSDGKALFLQERIWVR